jgi:hypothetical protein
MANPAMGPTENELDIAYIQAQSVRLSILLPFSLRYFRKLAHFVLFTFIHPE